MSLIESPAAPHRTFSEVLEALGHGENPRLTLDEVVDAFGDRGLGALILVLTLMALLPWPPGGKAVFAVPIIILAVELAFQVNEVRLPRWVLKASLPRAAYLKIISTPLAAPGWLRRWVLRAEMRLSQRGSRITFSNFARRLVRRRRRGLTVLRGFRRLEQLTRPRLHILTGAVAEILMGTACVGLAIIMALPVPFGDMLPGLAMMFFALGVMQKDGASVLVGAFWSLVTIAYLILIWATVVEIIEHVGAWFARLIG
jgi:hypothetical protein